MLTDIESQMQISVPSGSTDSGHRSIIYHLKTPKFHHITPILKSFHWFKINKTIKYKVHSLTYKSLKTSQPFHIRSLLSFPSHCCTKSSSLITFSRPSLTSSLKIANRSFYHSVPVLWNNLPSHLYVRLFITLLFIIQTHLCLIFQPLFSFTSLKPISFTRPFLLSLYSPRLSQDWYLRYWPITKIWYVIDQVSSFHVTHISHHSPSYHSRQFFYVIWLVSVYE